MRLATAIENRPRTRSTVRAGSPQRTARQGSQSQPGIFERPCSIWPRFGLIFERRFRQPLGGPLLVVGCAPLTAAPYAIANNLPYNLVTSFDLSDSNVAQETSTFFFFTNGGQFSNQTVLLAWSFQFIQPTIR